MLCLLHAYDEARRHVQVKSFYHASRLRRRFETSRAASRAFAAGRRISHTLLGSCVEISIQMTGLTTQNFRRIFQKFARPEPPTMIECSRVEKTEVLRHQRMHA